MSDLWEDCLEKSEEKTVFGTTGGPGELLARGEIRFSVASAKRTVTVTESRSAMRCREKRLFSLRARRYKLECVRANNRACFCVVGHTRSFRKAHYRVPGVMAFGTVACSLPESERLSALDLLVDKYSADFKDIAAKYIAGSFHRTEILRLDIEHLSGKHKELHK